MSANQKIGTAEPKSAKSRIQWSSQRLCLTLEKMPSGNAVATATANASNESSRVAANFNTMASDTGWLMVCE